ncbi:MAG TPA: DoxX family protein [Gemmatimonadaceae bacterium]|nr:DoxX family protein [Gemmatimonadaceae bacterium]
MPSTDAIDIELIDLGLLLIRVVFGLIFAAHGAQKLFGWFSGYGLTGTGEFMVNLGFTPGRAFATAASLSEFVGGLLLALGFLGPIGPALMLSVMIVAMVTVHWKNGFFVATSGIEHPLMFAVAAIGLALTGPGRYSVDYALGWQRWETPGLTWIVLAIGAIGGLLNLAVRRPAPKTT